MKSEVTPEELSQAITKMSFPSYVKKAAYEDAVVFIDGMTCMSCVRNIEGSVSVQNGVKFIRVSLDKKLGYVKFDPAFVSANGIKDSIEEMGFLASLTPPGEGHGNSPPDRATTYIEVSLFKGIFSLERMDITQKIKQKPPTLYTMQCWI